MVVARDKPEYITVDADFKPLPKYGHHSELDPVFAKLKPVVDGGMDAIWAPELSLEEFRDLWLKEAPPPADFPQEGEDVVLETRKVPVRDGADINVLVYRAKGQTSSSTTPALVLRLHGGGWVVGGPRTEHAENLLITGRTNSVVVSVDYRMAPEFKFPYALNDSVDALKWAKENASSLGVDSEKIILAGSSAGSNLATALAIIARDEGISGIRGQLLSFPVTCHPKFFPTDRYELGSYRQNHDASIVSAARMEWFLDTYMPDPTPDWRFSTLLAPSLANLPPACLLIGGYDIFRDEALAYAERLREEGGVGAEATVFGGMPHCFNAFDTHPKTIEYYGKVIGFVKRFAGE